MALLLLDTGLNNMKLIAQLNDLSQVINVVNIDDSVDDAEAYCFELYGGNWKESNIENRNHASIGATYPSDLNKFVLPKPFDSFVLNSDGLWEAPVPMPTSAGTWIWDEGSKKWNR